MCWATGRAGQLGCGQTAGELSNSVTWRLAAAAAGVGGGGVMLNLALTSTTTAQEPGHGAVVLWCCGAGHHHTHSCVLSALLPPLYSYHTSTSFQRDEFFDKAGITSQHKHIHNTINTDNNVHIILQKRSAPYKRSLQTIIMLLDHEGCDTVL